MGFGLVLIHCSLRRGCMLSQPYPMGPRDLMIRCLGLGLYVLGLLEKESGFPSRCFS